MKLTKTGTFSLLCAILVFQSCGWQSKDPVIAEENVENVELVLYLSDGDSDWKSVGETILIDSGELLHVRRNKVRPDAQLITNDWNNVFQHEFKKKPMLARLHSGWIGRMALFAMQIAAQLCTQFVLAGQE